MFYLKDVKGGEIHCKATQGFCIKIIVFLKNGAKEQNGFRKGSDCAAAQAANVYNYKHNQSLADVSAISKSRFRDWEPFFCKSKFIMRKPWLPHKLVTFQPCF